MKQRKIILTPSQQRLINEKLKQAKFDRLCKVILNDRSLSAQVRAEAIVKLKKKIFNK